MWRAVLCTDPPPRYIAAGGGIANGKSFIGRQIMAQWVSTIKRPFNILFCRQTQAQIAESVLPEIWEEHPSWKKWHTGGVANRIDFPDGRGSILFRHLTDNPLSNINASRVLIEQAEECKEADAMRAFRRMRRGPEQQSLILYNACGHDWIWRLFHNNRWEERDRSVCIEADSYVNRDNLPPDYVRFLDAMPDKDRRRWVLGSHETEAGCIFSFDDSCIIDPFAIPREWECKTVYDHGTACPAAYLVFAKDKATGITYICDEYYSPGEIDRHASSIRTIDKGYTVRKRVADAAIFARTGGDTVAELFEENGVRFERCIKSFDTSRSYVNQQFTSGKLKIFRPCVNTIREVRDWEWKRPRYDAQIVKEAPTDGNDHTCDCILYWGADENEKGVDVSDPRIQYKLRQELP